MTKEQIKQKNAREYQRVKDDGLWGLTKTGQCGMVQSD